MITSEQILDRHLTKVREGQRFAVLTFDGGNGELQAFLNRLPSNWRLVSTALARSIIESSSALFEITTTEQN